MAFRLDDVKEAMRTTKIQLGRTRSGKSALVWYPSASGDKFAVSWPGDDGTKQEKRFHDVDSAWEAFEQIQESEKI